jgi:hypothetical protein
MPINLISRFTHAPAQHQQPWPTTDAVVVELPPGRWS